MCSDTHRQTRRPEEACVRFIYPFLFMKQKHTLARKNLRQSKLLDPSPQAVSQTHREFVDGLLSECRLKVRAPSVRRWRRNADFVNCCLMPPKMFAGFLDQTDVDGEDGEGECGTGSGRSQHHRPAGEHPHPRSV